MDTGRITNLKIPHPSFNSSASIAHSNASLVSGSHSATNVPAQIQVVLTVVVGDVSVLQFLVVRLKYRIASTTFDRKWR